MWDSLSWYGATLKRLTDNKGPVMWLEGWHTWHVRNKRNLSSSAWSKEV